MVSKSRRRHLVFWPFLYVCIFIMPDTLGLVSLSGGMMKPGFSKTWNILGSCIAGPSCTLQEKVLAESIITLHKRKKRSSSFYFLKQVTFALLGLGATVPLLNNKMQWKVRKILSEIRLQWHVYISHICKYSSGFSKSRGDIRLGLGGMAKNSYHGKILTVCWYIHLFYF